MTIHAHQHRQIILEIQPYLSCFFLTSIKGIKESQAIYLSPSTTVHFLFSLPASIFSLFQWFALVESHSWSGSSARKL
jgi:uncharacterized membrane protein YhfC